MKHLSISLFILSFALFSCTPTKKIDNATMSTVVLKDTTSWKVDTITPGCVWYQYNQFYEPYNSNQFVNVLDVDLSDYDLDMVSNLEGDSLSAYAEQANAFAGINGSYFGVNMSFLKTKGEVNTQTNLTPDHMKYWKHEGAFCYDRESKKMKIVYGTNDSYLQLPYSDVMSGSPMLIFEGKAVGADYVGDISLEEIEKLKYEDYRRHQGVRHPRTAVAITENKRALLITVDGRWSSSAGMSAKELTLFIQKYFNAPNALNIDGGGSTTMWIEERPIESNCKVINYPTDDKKYTHYGQRKVKNVILVKKK